jgi:hypothetical protein
MWCYTPDDSLTIDVIVTSKCGLRIAGGAIFAVNKTAGM